MVRRHKGRGRGAGAGGESPSPGVGQACDARTAGLRHKAPGPSLSGAPRRDTSALPLLVPLAAVASDAPLDHQVSPVAALGPGCRPRRAMLQCDASRRRRHGAAVLSGRPLHSRGDPQIQSALMHAGMPSTNLRPADTLLARLHAPPAGVDGICVVRRRLPPALPPLQQRQPPADHGVGAPCWHASAHTRRCMVCAFACTPRRPAHATAAWGCCGARQQLQQGCTLAYYKALGQRIPGDYLACVAAQRRQRRNVAGIWTSPDLASPLAATSCPGSTILSCCRAAPALLSLRSSRRRARMGQGGRQSWRDLRRRARSRCSQSSCTPATAARPDRCALRPRP